MSSAVYALNDALDAERDRLHEKKRERPIAAGRISKAEAVLVRGALLAAPASGWRALSGASVALLVIAAYVAKELVYQLGLKHVPLVDMFLLSSGFVLRIVLGAELVGTAPSNWLLLVSSTLALFISLAKRRGELARGMDGAHRPALGLHRGVPRPGAGGDGRNDLDQRTRSLHGSEGAAGRAASSRCSPFVVFGVLEYLRLA